MKKYVTFVKDAEESRKVQEALFSAGFSWGGTRFNVMHTEEIYLVAILQFLPETSSPTPSNSTEPSNPKQR
jgi:hypothetical protein